MVADTDSTLANARVYGTRSVAAQMACASGPEVPSLKRRTTTRLPVHMYALPAGQAPEVAPLTVPILSIGELTLTAPARRPGDDRPR
ncbi:MAG: hypothetical protein ACYCYF_12645, partial [Anaerolineae bacterium]